MTVLDSFRLDNKVAVVTGGNRGIGMALARALGEAGARVAIAARDAARSETVAAELGALAVTTEITDGASVDAMLETEPTTGLPWVDLHSISTLVLVDLPPSRTASPPDGRRGTG